MEFPFFKYFTVPYEVVKSSIKSILSGAYEVAKN
jgi:hypothetical protein